jgi:hypothetical protein
MKTCGIPSIGEVRSCPAAVGVAAGVSVTDVAVGKTGCSIVAEGITTAVNAVAVGGICVEVGPATGACGPAQAARKRSRRKVGMMFFMDV